MGQVCTVDAGATDILSSVVERTVHAPDSNFGKNQTLIEKSGRMRQSVRFLFSTCVGLAVDLGVYATLTAAGVLAGVANFVSSFAAVLLMYFFSSRYVYASRARNSAGVLLFFAWYAVSISLFSWIVQMGVGAFGLHPIVSKLGCLPFSFVLNFLATRTIFSRFGMPQPEAQK